MSALAGAAAVLGSGFLASLWQLTRSPWALVPVAVAALMLAGRWYLGRSSRVMPLVALPPRGEAGDDTLAMLCPCCNTAGSDDCLCAVDCGAPRCQAADPGDDTEPWPAPRPACPWCDTRQCLDSTLCNCAEPCGSWLCVVKEASRG